MSALVASNALLLNRINSLRSILNSGFTLRLFVGPSTISPANILPDFSEANFGGYAGQSLAGDFAGPIKVRDGEYQVNSSVKNFACTGAPDNTVLGLYIDDGTDVFFSSLFDTPVIVTNGIAFTVTISPQDWALSII